VLIHVHFLSWIILIPSRDPLRVVGLLPGDNLCCLLGGISVRHDDVRRFEPTSQIQSGPPAARTSCKPWNHGVRFSSDTDRADRECCAIVSIVVTSYLAGSFR